MEGWNQRTHSLHWRPALPEDIPLCLKINPLISGEQVLGRERVRSVWSGLTSHVSFQSAVVETAEPVLGSNAVAFGASVFVRNNFAASEILHPEAGLVQRIVRGVAEERSALLSPEEIKHDNTAEGLNVIVMSAAIRPGLETRPGFPERLQALLTSAFLACQSGYRLRRILLEITDQSLRRRVEVMQSWQIFEYGASHAHPTEDGESLAVMALPDALTYGESLPALLFNYQEPRLHLTDVEQSLLQAAVIGITDREISSRLKVSEQTIKSRWLTIYHKADMILPEIFPVLELDEEERQSRTSRGPQRRHHLVNFVRNHPEELRPFDWTLHTKLHRLPQHQLPAPRPSPLPRATP